MADLLLARSGSLQGAEDVLGTLRRNRAARSYFSKNSSTGTMVTLSAAIFSG